MDIVGAVAVLLRKALFYNPHSSIFSVRFSSPTLPCLPFNILQRGGEHEVPSSLGGAMGVNRTPVDGHIIERKWKTQV